MLVQFLVALCLMSVCVTLHALGLTAAFRWVKRRLAPETRRFWPATWMLIRLAGWGIFLHLLEIAVWAGFYVWRDGMPDFPSAAYFSAVTYTTTGYGDLVLPVSWRLVGAVEALTGILMCAWSTGFFLAIFGRMHDTSAPHAHDVVSTPSRS
jgi:hypothetical protein